MKINFLIMLLLISSSLLGSENLLDEEKRKAVLESLSFNAKASSIKIVGEYMQANKDSAVTSLVKVKLGNKNLSTFIVTMSPAMAQYKIFNKLKGMDCINKPLDLLKKGQSLVNLQDVVDLNWKSAGNSAKGAFTVDKKGFYKIYCQFTAEKKEGKWKITELTIPSKIKGSPQLVVFNKETQLTVNDKLLASRHLSPKHAIKLLDSALKTSSRNIDVLIQKGKVCYKLKLKSKANKCFKDALELCGQDIENEIRILNLKIGTKLYLYTLLKEKEKGRKYFTKIKNDFPNNEELINNMKYIMSMPEAK